MAGYPKGQRPKIGCFLTWYMGAAIGREGTVLFIMIMMGAATKEFLGRQAAGWLGPFVEVFYFFLCALLVALIFCYVALLNGEAWAVKVLFGLKALGLAVSLLTGSIAFINVLLDFIIYYLLIDANRGAFFEYESQYGDEEKKAKYEYHRPDAEMAKFAASQPAKGFERAADRETDHVRMLFDSARVQAMGKNYREAIRLLDQAVAQGFADFQAMESDIHLQGVRDKNPEIFRRLVAKAQKQAGRA